MALEKTWRWFGEKDEVSLAEIAQMGMDGIVTALHHIPNGEVWPINEILKVKEKIESYGMRWSVVESLPVSEGIKTGNQNRDSLISNYITSLENLGKCGIDTVCYNFMPVLDWARTDIHYALPNNKGEGMYFDFPTFVAFDVFILKRPNAEKDYPANLIKLANEKFKAMSAEEAENLAYNIIVLTQGFIDGAIEEGTVDYKNVFQGFLDTYEAIDDKRLRENLSCFLKAIMPTAQKWGIKMCIHPDDPPFSVLGLPRIVSTIEDLQWITQQYPSTQNGITFCAGSLSSRADNNLVKIIETIGAHIHFVHLRSTQRLENGSFYETEHLKGSVDMFAVLTALLKEQKSRITQGRSDFRMPFRPDHGIKILDDFNRNANPGYPLIGRLKGVAEITGLEMGIERSGLLELD